MKKKIKKSIVIVGGAIILMGSAIAFSEPGSIEDPLVTLSYVNNTIDQIKEYIDVKIANIGNTGSHNGNTASNELVSIKVLAGESLIGKAGTEIILRSGKAVSIVTDSGGLPDVTAGVDIGKDKSIPRNHLLIMPRDDGRGVYVTEDAYLMVRGEYIVR